MSVSQPFAWIFTLAGVALIFAGVYMGLFLAPADARQGDAARIMFVHVPSAWLSMFAFAFMAWASLVSLVWRHALADVAAKSAAPFGAAFTALCLTTGSIWGYPIWGTWWEWDGRMTSVLILFFIYLGYIALWQAMDTPQKASRAAAVLCLVGAVNLPIIKFSVEWWNTLHQGRTVFAAGGSRAAPVFLLPLLLMSLSYMSAFGALWLVRIRGEVWRRRAAAAEARLAR
jgi:heme exporter protein C